MASEQKPYPETGEQCNCGLTSVLKQAGPQAKNAGRWFYCCPLLPTDQGRCKFFKFADTVQATPSQQQSKRRASSPPRIAKKQKLERHDAVADISPLLEDASASCSIPQMPHMPPAKTSMDRQFDQGLAQLNMANFQIMQRSLDQATLAITHLTHTLQMANFMKEKELQLAMTSTTPMRASPKTFVSQQSQTSDDEKKQTQ